MTDACNYCGTLVGVGSDYMCCDCHLAWLAGFNHPSRLDWIERAKKAEAELAHVRAELDRERVGADSLGAELARCRPVVDAALAWVAGPAYSPDLWYLPSADLVRVVDAYRAGEDR